jgi:hypothetical protein
MHDKHHRLAWTVLAIGMFLGLTRGPGLPADQPAAPSNAQPIDKMIAELKTISDLVKQLEDNNFDKRKQATERLLRMGPAAIEPLKRVLDGKPSLDMTTRVVNILRDLRKQQRKDSKLYGELAKQINLPDGIPNPSTLQDALGLLGEKTGLTFFIDSNAFAADEVQKVEESQVGLGRMMGVRLDTVLRLLLGQVKGQKYVGTYLIRGDHIEVTTTWHAGLQLSPGEGVLMPRVNSVLHREALEEALAQLSEATGISIVLDERVSDKGQKVVTAILNNVPLDTAVRVLADQTDLKPVLMDNLIYVTSKNNAKELEAEQEKRAAAAAKARAAMGGEEPAPVQGAPPAK